MRPTIQPPIPEREVDPALLEDLPASGTASPTQWRGTRTGLSRPTLASLKAPPATPASGIAGPTRARLAAGSRSARSATSDFDSDSDSDDTLVESLTEKDVNDYLLSKTLKPADVRSPTELVRPVSSREGLLAEGIWIARPFAYGEHPASFAGSLSSRTRPASQLLHCASTADERCCPSSSLCCWSCLHARCASARSPSPLARARTRCSLRCRAAIRSSAWSRHSSAARRATRPCRMWRLPSGSAAAVHSGGTCCAGQPGTAGQSESAGAH